MKVCLVRQMLASHVTCLWIVRLSHDNGGDLTAIIGLLAMRFASVAEEKQFVLVRAGRKASRATNSGVAEAPANEGGQIEMRTVGIVVRRTGGCRHGSPKIAFGSLVQPG